MNKSDPPTTFGVLKPVGHVLIAFHTQDELLAAVSRFSASGFKKDSMVEYSAEEMLALADKQLANSSPLANFGYELDVLRGYKDLAAKGNVFLIVNAPTEEEEEQVTRLLKTMNPISAQHYGRILIRDLTENPPDPTGSPPP